MKEEEIDCFSNLDEPTENENYESFYAKNKLPNKKTKEDKKFFMLKEKMMKKFWIKKLARETYKLLPNTEDSVLVKRAPNTHKIKLVESKHTALISKWMSSDTDDMSCIYCKQKGEVALDFVSLVVGCGACGEMAGVDYTTG